MNSTYLKALIEKLNSLIGGWAHSRRHVSGSWHPVLSWSLPQSGCLPLVSSFFNTLVTRRFFRSNVFLGNKSALEWSLEGDFIYIKHKAEGGEFSVRKIGPREHIPCLPHHQWHSHKSVFMYHPAPVLCELLANIKFSMGHAPEHKSHRMDSQGKKRLLSYAAHGKVPSGEEHREKKEREREPVSFHLIQHFLG